MTQDEADKILSSIESESVARWCESKTCFCTGCVNRSIPKVYQLKNNPEAYDRGDVIDWPTKEQWQDWKNRLFKRIKI
jgi:hypothetical protein